MNNKDCFKSSNSKELKRIKLDSFFLGLNTASDQSVLPLSISPFTYNFSFWDGALKDGFGIRQSEIDVDNITDIWRFYKNGENNQEILMFKMDGYIYYVKDNRAFMLSGVKTSGKISTYNFRLYGSDVLIIFSDLSPLIVWDGVNPAYTVSDSPRVKSMVTFDDYAFVADADGETIRFTQDLDPTNWNGPLSEGGQLRLVDERGQVNKLISFLGYLYVFRDFGISKIEVNNGQPTPAGLYVSSGKIYGDTVTLCGNKVMFLAEDGIYEFDGLNTKKVLNNLNGLIKPDKNAKAIFFCGSYYLACKIEYPLSRLSMPSFSSFLGSQKIGCESVQHTNNALIVLSVADKAYCVTRGVDIAAFCSYGGNVFAISNKKIVQITMDSYNFSLPLEKLWQSPYSDLGSERLKFIKEIHIETKGDILLSVCSERGQKLTYVKGKDYPQRVRLNHKGKKISFALLSFSPNSYITAPTLIYCLL